MDPDRIGHVGLDTPLRGYSTSERRQHSLLIE